MTGRTHAAVRVALVLSVAALAAVGSPSALDAQGAGPRNAGMTVASSRADDDGSGWSPGPLLTARVRERIAAQWAVEPEAVHLEWGAIRTGLVPAEAAGFELIGDGAGGSWIVVFTPSAPNLPAPRVWLRAGIEVREPVAARMLGRDHELGPDDITTASTIRWGGADRSEPRDLVGWVTRRQVRAGEPLREPAIAPAPAVRSGERVQAVWRRPGIALTLEARALGTASVGGRVFVRTDTGLRLEGTASARGVVEIDSPREVGS